MGRVVGAGHGEHAERRGCAKVCYNLCISAKLRLDLVRRYLGKDSRCAGSVEEDVNNGRRHRFRCFLLFSRGYMVSGDGIRANPFPTSELENSLLSKYTEATSSLSAGGDDLGPFLVFWLSETEGGDMGIFIAVEWYSPTMWWEARCEGRAMRV